jgi:hypothetical protein
VRRRACLHLVRHHIAAPSGCEQQLKEMDGILWLRACQEVHHVTTHKVEATRACRVGRLCAIEQAEALVHRQRAHLVGIHTTSLSERRAGLLVRQRKRLLLHIGCGAVGCGQLLLCERRAAAVAGRWS